MGLDNSLPNSQALWVLVWALCRCLLSVACGCLLGSCEDFGCHHLLGVSKGVGGIVCWAFLRAKGVIACGCLLGVITSWVLLRAEGVDACRLSYLQPYE